KGNHHCTDRDLYEEREEGGTSGARLLYGRKPWRNKGDHGTDLSACTQTGKRYRSVLSAASVPGNRGLCLGKKQQLYPGRICRLCQGGRHHQLCAGASEHLISGNGGIL